MSQKCYTDRCRRLSRALCKYCKKEFCLDHLCEHMQTIDSQLKPLKAEVEQVNGQLKALDIERAVNSFRQQIKQWRIDSYTVIDRLAEEKCREFGRCICEKVDQQRIDVHRLQYQIEELLATEGGNEGDIDSIKWKIGDLKESIQKVRQHTLPAFMLPPLTVDEQTVRRNR